MRSKTLSRCSTLTAVALSAVLLPLSTAHAANTSIAVVTPATTDAFGRTADAVLTDRTAALLDKNRAAPRTALSAKSTGGIKLSSALTKTEGVAITSLHGTRSRLAALGEAYTAADTKVTVDRTLVWGKKATAWVTETTTLTYKKIHGDEPGTTGFDAHHVLTFVAQSDGTWNLAGIRDTDQGSRQINQPVLATAARMTPMAVVDAPGSNHVSRARQPQEAHRRRVRLRGDGDLRREVLEELQHGLPEVQRGRR